MKSKQPYLGFELWCPLPFPTTMILTCIYHHHHHHHHHVVPLARISLTFSRHFSLSFIASGRSSGLHPVSSHSCCMYVRAGRPAFARPYVGVHRSTSLMSSSLILQQCPACVVRLTSGLHPVSSRSCCMYVRAGRPAFARPYVGVHWSTSLMSSSLIL